VLHDGYIHVLVNMHASGGPGKMRGTCNTFPVVLV